MDSYTWMCTTVCHPNCVGFFMFLWNTLDDGLSQKLGYPKSSWNYSTWHPWGWRNSRICHQQEKSCLLSSVTSPVCMTLNSDCCSATWRSLNVCLCLTSSSKKYAWSIAQPWKLQATHKCAHHWGIHIICVNRVAAPSLQSRSHTVRFSSVCTCERQPVKKLFCECQGTEEYHVPVVAEEREQLLLGGSTCHCSKMEGDCWQRWGLQWKITTLSAVFLWSEVKFSYSNL
jgi:hypothetical protein